MKRPVRSVTTVVVALALIISMSAAPAAALQDGDGLLGDDEGDDGLLGGDSGVDVGNDGVSIAGDDGVSVGTDGVAVGGDEGVNVSTDGVSVAGEEAGADSLDAVGDTDSPIDSAPGDSLPVGPDLVEDPALPELGDTSPSAPGLGNGSTGLGVLIGPDGIYDTEDSDLNLSRVVILSRLPDTGENTGPVQEALSPSTEDLPVSGEQVPDDALPTEQAPGPEALPVGSDSQIDCAKPIGADDLPLGAVPYIDDLPFEPPTVPLLPTRVASPENLAGLGFSFAPDQCEIYDPDDPSIDPTDPPTNLTGEVNTVDLSKQGDTFRYFGTSEGELEEGGPAWDGLLVIITTQERLRVVEDLRITDGKTDNYAGLETDMEAQRDFESSSGEYTVFLPGAGGLNTGYECGNVPESEIDPLEDPTVTCEINQPIPEVVTPEKVVDVVKNPPDYELPNIRGEQLPIDL